MFSKRVTTITIALSLVLITGVALAQGIGVQQLPGSGWTSGQQIQNVGNGPADIVAEAYDSSGGGPYAATGVTDGLTDVPVGESRNILENHWSGAPTSFEGSAVVSADEAIVAIVNVTNGSAAAQYQGVGSPNTEVGFPLFKNEFGPKHTTFYVQNASGTEAMIYATFTDDNGDKYTWNSGIPVPASTMVMFSPADATPSMPTQTKGGLVVTSTVAIAGAVLEHGTTDDTLLQATKGFSPDEYGTTLVAPLIKRQFGANPRSTGLQVQNVSDSAVDIYVTYVHAPLSGTPGAVHKQHKLSVDPGASYTFFENLIGDTGSEEVPLGSLASATITATGEIAAIVNETFFGGNIPNNRNTQTTYHAIAADDATQTVGVPLAKEYFGAAPKGSGIQVMNVGATTATVQIEYSFSETYTIIDQEIGPGGSQTYFNVHSTVPSGQWQSGNVLPQGEFGGAIVTADQNIVAIVQEADFTGAQDTKNYEGFNLQ
jgi:hypothetical protein